MKITIDAKNLDGPKPVISVKVEDDDPEVKKFFDKLHVSGPEKDEDNRFIHDLKYTNHSDGLATATLELDTVNVSKLLEILRPYY